MTNGMCNMPHELKACHRSRTPMLALSVRMGPATHNCWGRVRRLGMTLIELIVIIAIIALLLGIVLPSMFSVQKMSRKASTQTTINTLASACEIFKNEFKDSLKTYPDSTKANIDGINNMEGRHRLVYWLTGKSTNSPDSTGWRPGPRGKLYGADFFGIGNVPIMTEDKDNNLSFQDAFGHPIYYYSYRGSYIDDDNADGPPVTIQHYASVSPASESNPKPVTTSFLLMSQGADGTWPLRPEHWSSGAMDNFKDKGDDVTNFFNR